MAILSDIPEREGRSGEVQLAALRSYLKDTSKDQFTDSKLIQLLVKNSPVEIWRWMTGSLSDEVPWSYNSGEVGNHVALIRVLTGDTDEFAIMYTDKELINILSVMPLRYVVSIIKAKGAGGSDFPKDPQNPIHIVRKYLEDEDFLKYTNEEIVDRLFEQNVNPYDLVISEMNERVAVSAALRSESSGVLASLDGISFKTGTTEEVSNAVGDHWIITKTLLSSPYNKGTPCYGVWVDGENLLGEEESTGDWYAI